MADTFPIWMTQEQADRFTTELKAKGYEDITLTTEKSTLRITAKGRGLTFNRAAENPNDLADALSDFQWWLSQAKDQPE